MGAKYHFQLTSLNVLNPDNRPDEFEREALLAIEQGKSNTLTNYGEYATRESSEDGTRFRYFAPLYTQESCLSCHGEQGYQVGDIRGGISINFSTESIDKAKQNNLFLMIGGGLFTSGLISLLIYSMIYHNVIDPVQELETAAEKIGRGDFQSKIPVQRSDEIGDLARVLQSMQDEIQATMNKQVEYEKMYALGQLSSGIAHEIRNPLFAVRNDIDYLERKYNTSTEQGEIYREIEDGLSRVSRIINSVLDYSRPHALEFGYHSISALVERTMALLGKQLEQEDVSVHLDFDEDLPQVKMDIHRMEQVLVNLITNAMNAISGTDGKIVIEAKSFDQAIHLIIRDTGCGMSEEELRHIFDPFFTRSRGGTGLGLTIVHRIIHQHNGDIRVKSTEGIGTEFIVTLPVIHSKVAQDEI